MGYDRCSREGRLAEMAEGRGGQRAWSNRSFTRPRESHAEQGRALDLDVDGEA
jgi:hypothetical protein